MKEKKKEKDSEDEVGEFVLGSVGEELQMTKNCIFFQNSLFKKFSHSLGQTLTPPRTVDGVGWSWLQGG